MEIDEYQTNDEYDLNHQYCPNCKRKSFLVESCDVKYPVNKKDNFVYCEVCEWSGIVDNLIESSK